MCVAVRVGLVLLCGVLSCCVCDVFVVVVFVCLRVRCVAFLC